MKTNKPYFKNIPHIGDLFLDFVIFEYECPILFVCKDSKNTMFLCVCCDLRGAQRWIMAPIDKETLIDLLSDKIPIRDAFGAYKSKEVNRYLIEWKREYGEHFKCEVVKFEDVPDEDLPVEGEFIEAEEDEYKDIILKLKDVDNEREVMFSGTSIVNDFEYEAIKVQKFFASDAIDTKTITYCDVNSFYVMNTFEITEAKPLMKQVLIPIKRYKLIVDRVEKEAPILFNKKGELNFSTKLEDNCYVYTN